MGALSPQFIGHDEYYQQEVDRVQTLGRFISAEDLPVFVEDFVANYDRKSELIAEGPEIYRLEASEKLVRFIVEQPEDNQKSEFFKRLHQKSFRLTFDSEIAEGSRTFYLSMSGTFQFVALSTNTASMEHTSILSPECSCVRLVLCLPANTYTFGSRDNPSGARAGCAPTYRHQSSFACSPR